MSAATPQRHSAPFSPQNQAKLPNGTTAEARFRRTSRNRKENETESKDELRPAPPAPLRAGVVSTTLRPAINNRDPRTSTEGDSHAAHHPLAERQQCP